MAGQSPEIRTLVDVKSCSCPVFLCQYNRLEYGGFYAGMGKMRTGGVDAAGLGD